MSKFKFGDTVRCIEAGQSGGVLKLNKIYTIHSCHVKGDVEFATFTEDGAPWYASRFELCAPKFKKGDLVKRPHWDEYHEVVSFDGLTLSLKASQNTVADYTLNLDEFEFKCHSIENAKELLEAEGYTITPPKPKEKGKVVVWKNHHRDIFVYSKEFYDTVVKSDPHYPRKVLAIVDWEEEQGLSDG